MKAGARAAAPEKDYARVFAGVFGVFLGLALLKFGNPPIMEKWVAAPDTFWDFLLGYPWPITWGYGLLGLTGIAGLLAARCKTGAPTWVILLPAIWLVWEIVADTRSLDPALTAATLKHFAACVLCFYLGLFSLGRVKNLSPLWFGLFCGFFLTLAAGWEQHFGGLKETRRYFFLYIYPQMTEVPPDYLKKIASDRIFGTLFYPNALAGALLLLLPPAVAVLLRANRFTPAARLLLAGLAVTAGLGCLYWSGSKGGWLLMLATSMVALWRLPLSRALKATLLGMVLLAGLAGFFLKHAGFFEKGATSVGARFDYWEAALKTVQANPVFGTGPGTFFIPYQKLKRPKSEPARLVHNDYLEQASDSGLPGFLAYATFVIAALVFSFPKAAFRCSPVPSMDSASLRESLWKLTQTDESLRFSIWLGVLGFSLQGLMEFGLYIPALAWPAFALLGWLLANSRNAFDMPRGSS